MSKLACQGKKVHMNGGYLGKKVGMLLGKLKNKETEKARVQRRKRGRSSGQRYKGGYSSLT
jgi:hypothetical protein